LTKPHQLAVVPGTALVVRRTVFEQIKGFDERFFLYFEESDLCRRVITAGWEVWQIPSSKIKHIWHAATQGSEYNVFFRQSRYKYFEKHYGGIVATLLEVILQFGKVQLLIITAIAVIIGWFLLVK
jgi:hypothetical protein